MSIVDLVLLYSLQTRMKSNNIEKFDMMYIIHSKNFDIWSKLTLLIWNIRNWWNIDKMGFEVFHFSSTIHHLSCIGCNYLYAPTKCNLITPECNCLYMYKHLILANMAALFQVTLSAKEMEQKYFPSGCYFISHLHPATISCPSLFYRVGILWGIKYVRCRSWWSCLGRNWGWIFYSDTVCLWTI